MSLAPLVALAAGLLAGAATPGLPARLELVLVGSDADLEGLDARLADLVADGGEVTVSVTGPPGPGDRFPLDARSGDCPSAWVMVEEGSATVCAAGAGDGARLVCRSMPVATPLDEIGRERVGQVLRAALIAVIEADPPPAPAEAAPQPAAQSAAAEVAGSAAATTRAPLPGPALTSRYAWRLAALFTIEDAGPSARPGVGLSVSLRDTRSALHTEAWLALQYDLWNRAYGSTTSVLMHGQSARAGLAVELLSDLQVGAGLGVERIVLEGSPDFPGGPRGQTDRYLPVGRLFARAGRRLFGDISLYATAFLDASPDPLDVVTAGQMGDESVRALDRLRPGASLDVWWR